MSTIFEDIAKLYIYKVDIDSGNLENRTGNIRG